MRGFLRRCLERGGLRGVLRGRRYRNGREVRNREDETLSQKHDKCSSASFKIITTKPGKFYYFRFVRNKKFIVKYKLLGF